MRLSRQQADQLLAAGAISLPPCFPEVGRLTRTDTKATGPVVCVEHRTSPVQVNRYFVRIEEVRAAVNTKGKWRNPDSEEWLFGDAARGFLEALSDDEEAEKKSPGKQALPRIVYGIIFVREGVGVIMQVDRALAAGEISGYSKSCEDCRPKTYCEDCE